MRLAGCRSTSLFDGYGVNLVIFTQGCCHGCIGCQNPSTWEINGGYELTLKEIQADIISKLPLITGVTFSGGEPVLQFGEVRKLAIWCKAKGLTTTMYTGYTLEKHKDDFLLITSKEIHGIINKEQLKAFDYIIDGRYEDDKKCIDVPFRGSSNQRILKLGEDY